MDAVRIRSCPTRSLRTGLRRLLAAVVVVAASGPVQSQDLGGPSQRVAGPETGYYPTRWQAAPAGPTPSAAPSAWSTRSTTPAAAQLRPVLPVSHEVVLPPGVVPVAQPSAPASSDRPVLPEPTQLFRLESEEA